MIPAEFVRAFMPPLLLASLSGATTHLIGQYLEKILGNFSITVNAILSVGIMGAIYLLLIMLFLRAPMMRVIGLYKNRTLSI
jgi:hypothetical protein